MNDNNPIEKSNLLNSQIARKLSELEIENISIETGWAKHKPKKIFVSSLLVALFGSLSQGKWGGSLLSLSTSLSISNFLSFGQADGLSREAVRKRLNANFVKTLTRLVQKALENSISWADERSGPESKLFKSFNRIFIEDSTTFGLPDALFSYFPGNFSRGGRKAVGRVNLIFELKNHKCAVLDLKSYCENDQSAAGNIVGLVSKGDLVIRDLGYFAITHLKALQNKGADFLTRLKAGVNCLDIETGEKIELLSKLKKKGFLDEEVLVGQSLKFRCRLVAIKLPEHVAEERRRKAKKHRHACNNHSKEYYELLGWSLFITSVKQEVWSPKEIEKAYQSRWRIEIIFKTWKSHLNMLNLNKQGLKCPHAVESRIWAALLFIILFVNKIYAQARWLCFEITNKHLSIIKVAKMIAENLQILMQVQSLEHFIRLICYHCAYERRVDRVNMVEKYIGDYEVRQQS